MKVFESITVFIQYRMDGGNGERPQDRLIRGRVIQTTTPRGGVCRAVGDELIAPRRLTDRDMAKAHALCLSQLRGLTNRVVFEYDFLMGLEPETYPVTEVA